MEEKRIKTISKFLSLVLRHKPETIGINLDANGWASVSDLIQRSEAMGMKIEHAWLDWIVENNDKKRFAFNHDKTRIRANQGHSVKIDLGYTAQDPPENLYHGTGEKNVESIEKTGLLKKDRNHVHLSADPETARKVGQRHGKPVVFRVRAEAMSRDGYEFYLSENGVWLTDAVPAAYISRWNKKKA